MTYSYTAITGLIVKQSYKFDVPHHTARWKPNGETKKFGPLSAELLPYTLEELSNDLLDKNIDENVLNNCQDNASYRRQLTTLMENGIFTPKDFVASYGKIDSDSDLSIHQFLSDYGTMITTFLKGEIDDAGLKDPDELHKKIQILLTQLRDNLNELKGEA